MIRVLLAAALISAPTIVFRVDDARITEASGIAPGLRSPGVVYVQNDSGESNRFFALNARTGRTAATITVPGATNVDWEDIAVATDATGTASVWLADIGDNDADRDDIVVYRVDEPRIDADTRDRRIEADRPDVWRLRYPTGPIDAESLAVAPGGAAYIATKSLLGASVVYRLPARPDASRVRPLTRVADIPLSLATGAAFSRDGRMFAVRTYSDAYVWPVRGDLAAALAQPPTRVALPEQRQGEGIAISDGRLLLDSEGGRQPVYALPVPTTPAASPSASTSPGPSPSPGNSTSGGDNPTRNPALRGAVVIVIVGLAVYLRRYRRRPRAR